MAQSVGQQIIQNPAELQGVQLAAQGPVGQINVQPEARQIDLVIFVRQIGPQKFAQIGGLGVEYELRMLHLAVFMEGVHQLSEGGRLPLNGPQIALLLLGGHLAVADGVNVAGNDGDGSFEVVGDVGNQLLPALIQPLALRFTLGQPVGKTVKALPNTPDLPGSAAVPHPDHPALGLGDHRVVEPAQRPADPAAEPPDEEPCAEQEQGDKEEPNLPGILIAFHVIGVADHRLTQQNGHGLVVLIDKDPTGKKGVGKPLAGQVEKFLGRIDGLALLQAAKYDLIGAIQHHGVHRSVAHGLTDHQIAGFFVRVGQRKGGNGGICIPELDAVQFTGGAERVKPEIGGVDQQTIPVIDGKGAACVAGIAGQALVIAG